MNLIHIHLLLNHLPIIGSVIVIGLYLLAFARRSDELKRASFAMFVVLAAVTIPVFFSGYAARDAMTRRPDVSDALVQAHLDAAFLSLVMMGLTGVFAWYALWRFRPGSRPPRWTESVVLVLSVVTLAVMSATGYIGGAINHSEIRTGQEATTMPLLISTEAIRKFMNGPWEVWATTETLHFIGLSLLAGVALLINLRLLGLMKNIPFAALDRLLPWGLVGLGINIITGVAFFMGDPTQYDANPAFFFKMVFFLPAVGTFLYATMSEKAEAIGAGEAGPAIARMVGGSALVCWAAVLYFGRMLPYLGNAF